MFLGSLHPLSRPRTARSLERTATEKFVELLDCLPFDGDVDVVRHSCLAFSVRYQPVKHALILLLVVVPGWCISLYALLLTSPYHPESFSVVCGNFVQPKSKFVPIPLVFSPQTLHIMPCLVMVVSVTVNDRDCCHQ